VPSVANLRGTQAAFLALSAAGELLPGALYVLTDTKRVAVAITGSDYTILPQLGVDTASAPWAVRTASPKAAGAVSGTALGTINLVAARQYFVPFVVPTAKSITQLRISVTTLGAGLASVGVYANAFASGQDGPGDILVSALDLNTGTTGDKSGAAPLNLEPGRLYWASLIHAATCGVRGIAVGGISSALGFTANNTTAVTHLFAAGSGNVLPAVAPTSLTAGTGTAPAIYLVGT